MKTIVADENTRVTAELLDSQKPSRIVNSCRGRDHINYEACRERGVEVIETDYAPEDSVADHAIAMLLHLTCLGPKNAGRDGEETTGKRALIIGAGRIGMQIHQRLYGFNLETIEYYDPYSDFAHYNHSKQLPRALELADYVFLACPLTKENKGMIAYQELLRLKNKVLINVARSELVDPYYLAMAVKDWGLRVGWDFHDELHATNWPCWEALLHASARGNAVLTKHNAWRTREAKERRERAAREAKKVVKK